MHGTYIGICCKTTNHHFSHGHPYFLPLVGTIIPHPRARPGEALATYVADWSTSLFTGLQRVPHQVTCRLPKVGGTDNIIDDMHTYIGT
jgi:hypothetical protein